MDQSNRAYNDRNVYILGSGFSAEAGLPVIKDFMNRMRDAAAWLEAQGDRKKEFEAIERVLAFRLRAAAAAYRVPLNVENIEELFSLASASGDTKLSEDVTTAIAATLDFCREEGRARLKPVHVDRLGDSDWAKPQKWEIRNTHPQPVIRVYACPRYEFYVGLMSGYFSQDSPGRRDTIISFNYDTLVEDALWGLGLPFRYADSEMVEWQHPFDAAEVGRETIPVLKLHGSVNLAAEMLKDIGIQMLAYRTYADLRTKNHNPFLVAPTWQKSLTGYLSAVWTEAVAALRTATRVVVMGYSVPETDQHFRYLLAAGLQENISLRKVYFRNLDNNEEFSQRLYSLFRKEHVEQGIIAHETQSVDVFLRGSGPELIGRTFAEGVWRLST